MDWLDIKEFLKDIAKYFVIIVIILFIILEWIKNKRGEKNAKRLQTRQVN